MSERRDPVCINHHLGAGPCVGWAVVGDAWVECSRWPSTVTRPAMPSTPLGPQVDPHPDLVAAVAYYGRRQSAARKPHS